MKQRNIGILIGLIGLLITIGVFAFKYQEDKQVDTFVADKGTCYLDDGTCLHDQAQNNNGIYIFGWILSSVLIALALYIIFIDKTQEQLKEQNKEIVKSLKEAKIEVHKKDEFESFLKAFNDDEKKLLKIIRENEGITQSTLRFKSGFSKTGVSDMLKKLEANNIVARKQKGKTYEIFLKEK